jgi:hypothetical protein
MREIPALNQGEYIFVFVFPSLAIRMNRYRHWCNELPVKREVTANLTAGKKSAQSAYYYRAK